MKYIFYHIFVLKSMHFLIYCYWRDMFYNISRQHCTKLFAHGLDFRLSTINHLNQLRQIVNAATIERRISATQNCQNSNAVGSTKSIRPEIIMKGTINFMVLLVILFHFFCHFTPKIPIYNQLLTGVIASCIVHIGINAAGSNSMSLLFSQIKATITS